MTRAITQPQQTPEYASVAARQGQQQKLPVTDPTGDIPETSRQSTPRPPPPRESLPNWHLLFSVRLLAKRYADWYLLARMVRG